ncbi:MAG TPA: hypothetical protein VGN72_03630 [Tepidisphaeraceae bacterium]|jgi:beta-galactosidase|nr:hypothetical protein [Tepidisphaeraceae bacterium]
MLKSLKLQLAFLFAFVMAVGPAHAEPLPPIQSGFDAPDSGQWFSGWTAGDPAVVSRVTEQGTSFVRLQLKHQGSAMIERSIAIDPAWQSVEVTSRLRGKDVAPGEKNYETPMVQVIFKDAAGELVGGWPTKLQVAADADWHEQRHVYAVPDGAANVVLQLFILNSAGTFEVDWVRLKPLRKDEQPSAAGQTLRWDFEKLGSGWPVGFSRGDQSQVSIVEEAGNHFLRVNRRTKDESAIISNSIVVDPKWSAVTVGARVRMADLQKGEQAWMTGNVQSAFFDNSGEQVGGWPPKIGAQADMDWSPRTQRYDVPPGAATLRVDIGMWGSSGRFDVDDLTITPHGPSDLPAGERPRWGEEPVVALGEHRSEIVLNGLWRFVPGTIKEPQERHLGWVRVPASWHASAGPGMVVRGAEWGQIDLKELQAATYERPIEVPRDWDGRAVVLRLDRVSTDAVVYVDDKRVGEIHWPSGEVDLTSLVSPGKKHSLRIDVFATQHDEEVLEFMETMDLQVTRRKSTLETRGLTGDVVLLSRPRGAHLTDVAVVTSVRKKQLSVDIELRDVATAGRATVSAEVIDRATGDIVKAFRDTVQVEAVATQRVRAGWDWADPKLWDVGQPNLYDLRLTITNDGDLRDSQRVTFGFREFWTEGKQFILNGTAIRLRPFLAPNGYFAFDGVPSAAAGRLAGLQKSGFNFIEVWPNDITRRGSDHTFDVWYREADKLGLLISGVLPTVNGAIIDSNWRQIWNTERGKTAWQPRVADHLRGRRNSPSVVMWAISGNFFGHSHDQNPRMIGRRGVYDEKPARVAGREAVEIARALDPTRAIITHQGGDVGDVHTINMYLNLIPLQEREEWLSEWVESGEMPLMPVEFGVPQFNTYLRGRNGFGGSILTEPWLTEFAAIYFGREAYAAEPDEYRQGMRTRFKQEQEYASWHAGSELLGQSENMQRLTSLFIKNTWRTWRTWGITGGMIPWDQGYIWSHHADQNTTEDLAFVPGQRGRYAPTLPLHAKATFQPPHSKLTPSGKVFVANGGTTLAWIAGGNAEHFTDKDHLFTASDRVSKQIAIINDERVELPYAGTWRASVAGREVASGKVAGRILPATNRFEPIEFTLPADATEPKQAGEIIIEMLIGQTSHTDTFAFRTFKQPVPTKRTVAAVDPRGLSTKMLRSVGAEVAGLDAAGTASPVVIGRQALDGDPNALGQLEAQIRAGRTVIVFSQSQEVLSRYFGFRTSPHVSRRVFRVDEGHPITAGLDDADLRDWNGSSTLIEPKPDMTGPNVKLGASSPYYGWHWGNRGSVATGAIEKPHHSGWTPILECEFDLAYSPLMELQVGKGRVIWCQLDLEDQIHTPSARILLDQLLSYAAKPSERSSAPAVYIGDDAGQKMLASLALSFEVAEGLPDAGQLVILGSGASVSDEALRSYIEQGGRVLVLAQDAESGRLGVSYESGSTTGALALPSWPETNGLSPSDLRLRNTADLNRIRSGGEVAANGLLSRLAIGRGVAVFTQIDPTALDADSKTYMRFSRWRQTRALSQLLANMGGQFIADRRVFKPVDAVEPSVDLAGTWRAKYVTRIEDPNGDLHPDPGMSESAEALLAVTVADDEWDKVKAPGSLEDLGAPWAAANGEIVLRKTIDVTEAMAARDLVLELGPIDDFDVTFVNGQRVGGSPDSATSQWNVDRKYALPAGLIKPGKNVIAIRLWDQFGGGGFNGPAPKMKLAPTPTIDAAPLYHADYRTDYELGDDPYRYYRW